MKRNFGFFVLIFAAAFPALALYNDFGIPDSTEIRKDLVETWFEAPLSDVRMNIPEIRSNRIGSKFQVRLEETEDSFNIFVAPHAVISVDVYSDERKTTEIQDIYPGDAPGSWVLVRDKKNGKPLRIRYYFASDSEVFVQFSPNGKTASADFLIYGLYASRGAPTGLKFERFYTASFAEVMEWTKGILPWHYAKFFKDDYHASLQMINMIREKLPQIVFTEDAMYDDENIPVYISTGKTRVIGEDFRDKITVNGAGFLKWIADGITEPLTGGKLRRIPLLTETVQFKDNGFQGVLSQKYALTFSLDWIRNLSVAIYSLRTGKSYSIGQVGVDVKTEPFASELTDKGIKNTAGFIENSGYSARKLKPLLYVLASTEPETFYFAAIREIDNRSPEVKVFNECAVLFPYFSSSGNFKCIVFKDGEELSFEDFIDRYSYDYVFLTRVRCTERFFP